MKTDSLLLATIPPHPTNDGQFALYLLCFMIVALVGLWLWFKRDADKAESKERKGDDHVIAQLQIMEVKFESMVSEIKGSLIGEHRLLKQKVESIQAELSEFKREFREHRDR